MNKILKPFLVSLIPVIAFAALMWWQTDVFSEEVAPTQEEQWQELANLLTSDDLLANLLTSGVLTAAIEASGGIATFLNDGENDRSLLLAELSNENIRDEMKKYTRRVVIRLSKLMNKEEVKNFIGVDILKQDVLDSFSGDLLRVNVAEQVVLGILTKDSVLLSLNHFRLDEIPTGLGIESISFIEVVLLPDLAKEDSWKKEDLFDGSVIDLLTGEHKFDIDTKLISFNRPDDKLIINPEGYSYEQVAPNVYPLDQILYMRPAGEDVSFPKGSVLYVDSKLGIFTIEGQFYVEDSGSPVFILNDGNIQWAGVIINQQGDRATVLDIQTLRTREGK